MSANCHLPAFPVPHPGELLREEILPLLDFRPAQAARQLGVSRQSLHAILDGHAGISADMALRFAALFGNSPMHWLNMQAIYDLQRSAKRLRKDIAHIEPVAA